MSSATLEYRYKARTRTGQSVEGTLQAASESEAAKQLLDQALFPIQLQAQRGMPTLRLGGAGVGARQLAVFYSQMADLLKAGVPLLRALKILARQSRSAKFQAVLTDIQQRVADGESIADAMGRHQRVFGELSVSMIRAGQEGGFLEDVFKRISKFTDQQEDLKARVMGAIAYPIVLSLIGGIIVSVLLIYFVPQFSKIFDRLRARGELPAATESLLAFSELVQSYWLIGLAAGIAAYIAWQRYIETPAGRRLLDTVKLRLPLAGQVFQNLAITRFNRVLGTLRLNGVPILNALRIAKDSTGNLLLQEAIDRAASNVQAGEKLASPLRASGCFPPEIVEMIEIAEESNNLETVLLESADSLELRTTRQLDLAVRFLEPLLLLLMAAVTMLVVVALLLPIFKMSSAL